MHGTAVVVGRRGILIVGPSGSGKTTLALELMQRGVGAGLFSSLVSDDRIFVSAAAGKLILQRPGTIAGLVEIHGLGPTPIPSVASAIADVLVDISNGDDAPRYQEALPVSIQGISIPRLTLRQRDTARSASVVFAHLGIGLFAGMPKND